MCAKIRKIINNSAGDCSISLKFRTDFDHVILDVPRTSTINWYSADNLGLSSTTVTQ